MKLYCVRTLFTVLVRCPLHTPVGTPMYRVPLSQIKSQNFFVFQSVYDLYCMKTSHTANASKLIEKYFLDLRSKSEHFSQNKKTYPAEKNFPVPSVRKFILIQENGLKIRTIFLKREILSLFNRHQFLLKIKLMQNETNLWSTFLVKMKYW